MTHYPWRRAKFVVEVPVSGPISDRRMRSSLEQHLHSFHAVYSMIPVMQIGRPRVKNYSSYMAAQKRKVKK